MRLPRPATTAIATVAILVTAGVAGSEASANFKARLLPIGQVPTLSATAPARLTQQVSHASPLPMTGAELVPELLLGLGLVLGGAGGRAVRSRRSP